MGVECSSFPPSLPPSCGAGVCWTWSSVCKLPALPSVLKAKVFWLLPMAPSWGVLCQVCQVLLLSWHLSAGILITLKTAEAASSGAQHPSGDLSSLKFLAPEPSFLGQGCGGTCTSVRNSFLSLMQKWTTG